MNEDGYQEGYDRGHADAEAGRDRDLRPNFVRAVVSEDYRRSYTEGYTTGYRDGKRESAKN